MTDSHATVIPVTHVNLSDSLGPHHLHIREHLMKLFPELAEVRHWHPRSLSEQMSMATNDSPNKRPLTVFSDADTLPPALTFNIALAKNPIITVYKHKPSWLYILHCLLIPEGNHIGKQMAKVLIEENGFRIENSFEDLAFSPIKT